MEQVFAYDGFALQFAHAFGVFSETALDCFAVCVINFADTHLFLALGL
jgi:hypothetical protein